MKGLLILFALVFSASSFAALPEGCETDQAMVKKRDILNMLNVCAMLTESKPCGDINSQARTVLSAAAGAVGVATSGAKSSKWFEKKQAELANLTIGKLKPTEKERYLRYFGLEVNAATMEKYKDVAIFKALDDQTLKSYQLDVAIKYIDERIATNEPEVKNLGQDEIYRREFRNENDALRMIRNMIKSADPADRDQALALMEGLADDRIDVKNPFVHRNIKSNVVVDSFIHPKAEWLKGTTFRGTAMKSAFDRLANFWPHSSEMAFENFRASPYAREHLPSMFNVEKYQEHMPESFPRRSAFAKAKAIGGGAGGIAVSLAVAYMVAPTHVATEAERVPACATMDREILNHFNGTAAKEYMKMDVGSKIPFDIKNPSEAVRDGKPN